MTMFVRGEYKYQVPIIFIESENDIDGDITNETRKLLYLNAPLKILITKGDLKVDIINNDTHWKYLIDDFKQFNRLSGFFVVISVVWNNDTPEYQYIAYNDQGKEVCELKKYH